VPIRGAAMPAHMQFFPATVSAPLPNHIEIL
jgi:hypothetical protein